MLRWFEHSRVYFPLRDLEATGAELGRPFEDVFFKSRDGVELNGWFYPAEKSSPRAHLAVLICHGNAGNISTRMGLYYALLKTGANVFAFDYRGFGRSQGRVGEEGTYLDAQAAHAWLRSKGLKNIIAYGESLGGGVVSELALREPVRGVILESTFTSIPDIGSELYPWLPVRLISSIKYDTRRKLPQLKVPVLIMHSPDDNLIGYRHSQQNFAAANEPKFFCELKGGHCEAVWDQPGFREAVERFLAVVEGTS